MLNSPARIAWRVARVEGRSRRLGASRPMIAKPEDRQDDGRPGRPQHGADVLLGRHAADHRRHEDGRLGDRRHLVAEVGAGDHGAGRDHRVRAEDRRQRHEGDAQGGGGGPRAADGQAHQPAHDRRRGVEPRCAQQPDAVVDDGRDRAGHVPGADERADREEDEHRARGPSEMPPTTASRTRTTVVPVLERDEAGDHRAGEQRDLQRAAGRIGPEQPDRQADQADQGDDRDQRVEQRRLADPGRLVVVDRDLVVHRRTVMRRSAQPRPGADAPDRSWSSGPRAKSTSRWPPRSGRPPPPRRQRPSSHQSFMRHLRSDRGRPGTSCSARRRVPCRARSRRSRRPRRRPRASSRS